METSLKLAAFFLASQRANSLFRQHMAHSHEDHEDGKVVIFIDMEKFKVDSEEVSVRALLTMAKEDPETSTLVERHGNDNTPHENLDEIIKLKNGMKFVVFHKKPTPVSDGVSFGADRLALEFTEIGFAVEKTAGSDGQNFIVIRDYEVPLGRFAGEVIGLAFAALPNYPQAVAPSIHVSSQGEIGKLESSPSKRNVQPSPLGESWHYWSHTFFSCDGEYGARNLMSQVNRIFLDA